MSDARRRREGGRPTRSTGPPPSASPGSSPGATRSPTRISARRSHADFDALDGRSRRSRRRLHRAARARARRTPRCSTARGWVDANVASMRRCSLRSPSASASGWRTTRRADRPAVAGDEIGSLLGYLAQARARPVRPARARRRRRPARPRRGLLRRPQRAVAREALRVPAARLPALDRDPRGHAPRPVHRRAVDARLLPSLVRGFAVIVDPDPRVLLRAIGRAADAVRAGRNPLDDGGLVGLFASPEQQASSVRCRR